MLKIFLITTTVSALISSGAFAQQDAPAGRTNQETAPVASAKFVTAQRADQWVFTKYKGTDVLGPDNANIGAVNDLLIDQTGKIAGVVVGIGGFLGIGAKNVAIDMSAFDVVPAGAGGNDNNNASAAKSNDPGSVKLKVAWTKDQLKEAPDFEYYKPPARTVTTSSPATTGAAPPAIPRPPTQ